MASRGTVLSNIKEQVAVSPTSFLRTLQSWPTSPANQFMWLVTFESQDSTGHFPPSVLNQVVRNLEFIDYDKNNDWQLTEESNYFNTDTDVVNKTELAACMMVQGVNIPGEQVNYEYASIGNAGGILPVLYGNERFEPQEMTTAVYESNSSFLDTVIRPWIVLASHHGNLTRPISDPRNVKCTIKITQLAKTIPRELTEDIVGNAEASHIDAWGRPHVGVTGANRGVLHTGINSSSESSVIVRKQFVFFNAVPTRMEAADLTYNADGGVLQRNVTWAYTHYAVRSYNDHITPTLDNFFESEVQGSKRSAAISIWNNKFKYLDSKYPTNEPEGPYAIPKVAGDGVNPMYSEVPAGTLGTGHGVTVKQLKETYIKNKLRQLANQGLNGVPGERWLQLYGPKGAGYQLSFEQPGATFEERWKVIKAKNLCIDPFNPSKDVCVPEAPPPGSALDKIRKGLKDIRKLANNARGFANAFKKVGKAKGTRGKLSALGDLNKSFKTLGGGGAKRKGERHKTLGGGMPKVKGPGKTTKGISGAIDIVDSAKKAARAVLGKSKAKGGF